MRLFSQRSFALSGRSMSGVLYISLLGLLVGGQGWLYEVHTAGATGVQQYNEFWSQQSGRDFQGWQQDEVVAEDEGIHADVQLSGTKRISCHSRDIDGGQVSYAKQVGLCQGRDPYPARSYERGRNYYNGGTFYFGILTSPIHMLQKPFTALVASWNALTPSGTWLEFHVRVLEGARWTHWYNLPIWASDSSTITRHSIEVPGDSMGVVDTDTFLTGKTAAHAYQIAVTLFTTSASISPHLKRVNVIASYDTNAQTTPFVPPLKAAWGVNLAVPQRSQMLAAYRNLGFGGGGEAWCSPTSTSMIMAYWSKQLNQPSLLQSVPEVASHTYDYTYDGAGNWPMNTAYAGSYNLKSFVTRMYSLSQLESWILAGVPIAASVAYRPGALPGSPIASSPGHLLVVRGFTEHGDVVTNDPAAASDEQVQIIYPRARFETVWLNASHGTVYVIYPEKWLTPMLNRLNSW
ncbi:hypothetical protein KDA_14940 [Dictyobacter alpinus]|uniref:Peptidase C39-like domain-containing protein n=1 Tax=Dictyobacter alpinus TaxID=2014873 RepID=A0A402B3S7_9CHLR|nr:C39 family peptidase [Dictyobacter alpinus]GCE26010.1 hypothetical protein KDA_14940 [Dictyobacter alpinus]